MLKPLVTLHLRRSATCGLLVTMLSLLLVACGTVVSSRDTLNVDAEGCHSALGGYNLPRSHLRIVIETEVEPKGDSFELTTTHKLTRLGQQLRPDPDHRYCLDYHATPWAADDLQVRRTASAVDNTEGDHPIEKIEPAGNSFLQLVTSKAQDRSGIVIQKLIRAAFIALSKNSQFTSRRSTVNLDDDDKIKSVTVADMEVDPFKPGELAVVNRRVRTFGFCFILVDFSFDPKRTDANRYCDSPVQIVRRHPSPVALRALKQKPLVEKIKPGIYYRPRTDYRLAVYVKDDPDGPGPWRLAKLQNIAMENISPVISVNVDRAMFTERRTILVFDNGALKDVCLTKGSELAGFIEIPIDVVYGIVALPAQTIQAQIGTLLAREELIKAETSLIEAQEAAIQFERNKGSVVLPEQFKTKTNASGKDVDSAFIVRDDKTKELFDEHGELADPVLRISKKAFDEIGAFSAAGELPSICNNIHREAKL